MTAEIASITLSEWNTRGPADTPVLANRFLDSQPGMRSVAERLVASQLVEITELRQGLEVTTFSHVGRVRVGGLSITILPKLKGASLLSLVRYAYGFRHLNLFSDTTHRVDQWGFEDLLIHQLNAEIQELISRGLLRAYVARNEWLSSPRGRIDVTRLALDGGTVTAALPCLHYPRIEDTLLNRVLMAGLRLAASMAGAVELRRESRRLVTLMEEQVSSARLNIALLDRAARQMNRLTSVYGSALSIIRLLLEAAGVVLEGQTTAEKLPGFLFDMNAFFQALMSRFLRENLPGYSLRDEHALKGMMRYNPKFNPRQRQSPTPRPDYVVMQGPSVVSILDAKYRDLWEKPLPREMLYQLVVYAISHGSQPRSTILYPTMDPLADEARIDVSDSLYGEHLGQVCLRPMLLSKVESLVHDMSSQARREREKYASQLAFGKRT